MTLYSLVGASTPEMEVIRSSKKLTTTYKTARHHKPKTTTDDTMMEAVRTSETSVDNHFTRQYIPEDSSEHHTYVMFCGEPSKQKWNKFCDIFNSK
jgi:hypothetical protein